MREQLTVIYQLQELDKELAGRTKNLKAHPILTEFANLKKDYERSKTELDSKEEAVAKRRKSLKKLEMDIEEISENIKSFKKKLYSGEISSTKEMSQYEKKLSSLEKGKNAKEEDLLSLMEKLEEEEEDIVSLREGLKERRAKLKEMQNEGQLKINILKSEIEEINRKRQGIRSKADDLLLNAYDQQAVKYKGLLIARVNNKMCEGCRVFLSSSVLSVLDDPKSKAKCENCGRILLKA